MGVPRSVLLLGATGLVGGECLRMLQDDDAFGRIVLLTRRALDRRLLGGKVEAHTIDFDHLTAAARFFAVDQIMCALGTTMRDAGSRRRFRQVDLLYPLTAAHLGIEKKVSHFLLVSAHGADPRSRFFYNRIKGELEQAVRALPYRSVTIARPSVLIGKRERPRTGERIAAGLSFLTPAKLRPINASDVAKALIHQAALDEPGFRLLESAQMRRVGQKVAPSSLFGGLPSDAGQKLRESSVA
jgi:uncharacterized protein YbjT (DUF2867 family)